MNIIEAEDLVKGLPDQALFQEAQFPSGRIPQFLAVSEVQRRQDMRQRFQAAQQGQQPSVKDQILQGGIGSTGMAPEMTSAPPMAPPMPPQGGPMPPQMPPPVGMAGGGIAPGGMVYMQEGRTVPGAGIAGTGTAFEGARAFGNLFKSPRYLVERKAAELIQRGMPQEAMALLQENRIDPRKVFDSVQAPSAPPAAAPSAAAPPAAPASVNAMPDQRQSFSLSPNYGMPSVPSNAPQRNAPPRDVVDQGIPAAGAAMNAPRQQAGATIPRPQAGADTSPMGYFANLLKPYERPTEVQASIDLARSMSEQGIPPPVDLTKYIQSAQQRQQEARDEARQMAIANTLMNLGTGLVAGDPAAGLQRATQAATETLREGRREAQAEGRMAEQLQLQAAQQNRQNLLDNMKFRSESVNAIANIISGEEKTTRETQMQAAQILSNYQINLQRMQNDLAVAGMGRNDANRRVQSEARNRATEIVLKSAEGKIPPPSAEEMARQVDIITSQFLGGMDSSSSATNKTLNPPPQSAIDFLIKNPNLRDEFERKYGAGSARQYLGG